jgi:hypothetical protein
MPHISLEPFGSPRFNALTNRAAATAATVFILPEAAGEFQIGDSQ